MSAKSKLIRDRMKDFEDVASGGKATRVVGGGKKDTKGTQQPKDPQRYGCGGPVKKYKYGGPVKRCRASRS